MHELVFRLVGARQYIICSEIPMYWKQDRYTTAPFTERKAEHRNNPEGYRIRFITATNK